jgi:hypothetical protein
MLLRGKAYRVSSEENGFALLDLIVCEACRSQAQALGLTIEELGILNKSALNLVEAVTVKDL